MKLGNEKVQIVNGFTPLAAYMASLVDKALLENQFVNVAYFELFYLKDFVVENRM